jgi:hypothetical protein
MQNNAEYEEKNAKKKMHNSYSAYFPNITAYIACYNMQNM